MERMEERMNRKTIPAILLTLCILVAEAFAPMCAAASSTQYFQDVPQDHWAVSYISSAFEDGVIGGTYYDAATGERRFSPSNTLTKVQFATILFNLTRPGQTATLCSTYSLNWSEAILVLLQGYGLEVTLGADSAGLNQPISRYDMVRYMVEILAGDEIIHKTEYAVEASLQYFADGDSVPAAYREAVAIARDAQLIGGYPDGTFGGSNFMTRAEASVVYCMFRNRFASFYQETQPALPVLPEPVKPGNPDPILPPDPDPELPVMPVIPEEPESAAIPTDPFIQEVANEIIRMTNESRTAEGLSALRMDESLKEGAFIRAQELSTHFSHTRPDGSKFNTAFGSDKAMAIGENCAYAGFSGTKNAQQIATKLMSMWLSSSGHRANIMKAEYGGFNVGVYIVEKGGTYEVYATQSFILASY